MINVIIIDDSMVIRKIVSDQIEIDKNFKVIAKAKNGQEGIEMIKNFRPDIVILDIEMPVLDGLSTLKELNRQNIKIPVIMLSALTQEGADATFQALELGAFDFIPKPSADNNFDPSILGNLVREKILSFFETKNLKLSNFRKDHIRTLSKEKRNIQIIGIGISTGGPKALHTLFEQIPKGFKIPIIVVQHMPAGFTKAFSKRLDSISNINVKEAENGEKIQDGCAYIAPGEFHLMVKSNGNDKVIELNQDPIVNGFRPSVQPMMESLLKEYRTNMIGIIMTGMGFDGSAVMLELRNKGVPTIAQDQDSSVVFGMNRRAIELGGIDYVEPLDMIMSRILEISQ